MEENRGKMLNAEPTIILSLFGNGIIQGKMIMQNPSNLNSAIFNLYDNHTIHEIAKVK